MEFDSGYRQSDYFISIKAGQYSVTRMNHVLGEKYKFDVLQVDGMIENSIEGAYGLVFGWNSNPPTTYHFMISVGGKHSGEYLIERRTQTKRENVIDWTKSSSIKTGRNVVNRVALSSQASVITTSVNGSVLATFTDSNQLSGFVGVIAQTFDQASVLFIFDNFYMSGN